jgi:arginyl-tRNA synthetase
VTQPPIVATTIYQPLLCFFDPSARIPYTESLSQPKRSRVYHIVEARVREALREFIRSRYDADVRVGTERPPRIEMGEVASPVCFELAKRLKRAPRQIAQEIASGIGAVEGVERFEVAGGGYLNAYLDRAAFFAMVFEHAGREARAAEADAPKHIVEHTCINPNKAAHIGHLRNAALGDTFARLLRHTGRRVEVQNYIDNTGVQVADVVLGLLHLEKKTPEEVRALAARPRFDFYCWDLYARVTQFLEEDKTRLALRADLLKKIEEGHGAEAQVGQAVADAIVHLHLRTMERLEVEYDLLPRESEILHLKFWDAAFELLKERGAIELATTGKNAGCWVMRLAEAESNSEEDPEAGVKIIVRSNGTVTYVGKDIAYHLWKFGLLGRDFGYAPFDSHPSGRTVWVTAEKTNPAAPEFGRGAHLYNVIDARQAYLQAVVAQGLRALGYAEQAERLVHFAYEVVALTARCAAELGYEASAEDATQAVEMSGRRGLGVKADDLLDRLEAGARAEVDARHPNEPEEFRARTAHAIAIGALRYFLLKYTRTAIIAFDFKDALSFEGDTGPYCQYAVVRALNIFRKAAEQSGASMQAPAGANISYDPGGAMPEDAKRHLAAPAGDDLWELLLLTGLLGTSVEAAVAAQEPAFVAKYASQLAQAFNNFYHKHHILSEADASRRGFLLALTALATRQLVTALNLLGIEAPEKM